MVKRCVVYLNLNITCVVNLYITSVVSPYLLLALFICICYIFKRFYTKNNRLTFSKFSMSSPNDKMLTCKREYLYMLPVLYTCTGEPYVTCVVYLYVLIVL